jgi:phosphoglycolate phosphatase
MSASEGGSPLALFWDIDGTLLSTAQAGVFALEDAAREVLRVEPDFSSLNTPGLTDFQVATVAIEAAGGEPSPATVEAFVRVYERELPGRLHARRGSVLTGVEAILEDLAGREDVLSLLLTGNTEAGARAKLHHYGLLDYFPAGAFSLDGSDRASIARRARDLAAEKLGASPPAERMWVIGDTPRDVECGQAIGVYTLAVASGGYTVEELRASEPTVAIEALPEPEAFLELVGHASGRA